MTSFIVVYSLLKAVMLSVNLYEIILIVLVTGYLLLMHRYVQ